jgi:hypothetical protein
MTSDERLERIEHLTAGLAEERRKDREEYKTLWRDTPRQLNELGTKVLQLSEESVDITIKLREADSRLEARIHQLADESRAADQRLEERIGSLVSAIGQFLTKSQ